MNLARTFWILLAFSVRPSFLVGTKQDPSCYRELVIRGLLFLIVWLIKSIDNFSCTNYIVSTFTLRLPITLSILLLPTNPSHVFDCFVLWLTEMYQGRLYNYGSRAICWSLLESGNWDSGSHFAEAIFVQQFRGKTSWDPPLSWW